MAIIKDLEAQREYFASIGSHDIVMVIDAIRDCDHGLGMIWQSTDCDAILDTLNSYPDNWIIGQARDWLRAEVAQRRAQSGQDDGDAV